MDDTVDIEISEIVVKDIVDKIDTKDIKITKQKEAADFIGSYICRAIKFPIIIDIKSEEILIGKDKLQILKMFLTNNLEISANSLGLYFGSGFASDLPTEIYERLLYDTLTVIYMDKKDFSKEVMDSIAKEINFYPYPQCISTIL